MMPSRPKVKKVTVTVELEDGRVSITESRPGAIDQNEGVTIRTDVKEPSLSDTWPVGAGTMIDVRKTTTVTWTEEWTDILR